MIKPCSLIFANTNKYLYFEMFMRMKLLNKRKNTLLKLYYLTEWLFAFDLLYDTFKFIDKYLSHWNYILNNFAFFRLM